MAQDVLSAALANWFLGSTHPSMTRGPCPALPALPACRTPAQTKRAVLPHDASCEDIAVDPSLPFLEAFVQQVHHNCAACFPAPQGVMNFGEARQVRRLTSLHARDVRLALAPGDDGCLQARACCNGYPLMLRLEKCNACS